MYNPGPVVLFLFNSSDYAVQPWLDDGRCAVVSVDYDNTDHSAAHRAPAGGHLRLNIDLSKGAASVVEVLAQLRLILGSSGPSLVVAFPPCTDLAVSGAKHFKRKLEADPDCQSRAVEMAMLATLFGCPYLVENPVSILSTLWRKPDHYWHPHEYSGYCPVGPHPEFPDVIPAQDLYPKKSGAWIGNGFVMPMKDDTFQPFAADNPGWAKLGGKSARTKYIRSLTPRGFARAVYEANINNVIGY